MPRCLKMKEIDIEFEFWETVNGGKRESSIQFPPMYTYSLFINTSIC